MAWRTCKECGNRMLYVSWSQIRTAEECKQKAHLSRQHKRARLADTRNFFPGNVTDRVVRNWLDGDDHTPGTLKLMVETVMNRERENIIKGTPDPDPKKHVEPGVMKWKDAGDRDRVLRECEAAAEKIEPLLLRHVIPYEYQADFRVEGQLQIPGPPQMGGVSETIMLHGYIDILVRDNNGNWWVFDVKHTKDEYYWRKTIGQLTFYDLGLMAMFGQKTMGTALLQPLCKRTTHPHQVTDQARTELLQRIIRYSHGRLLEDYSPTTNRKECTMCDFKHACPVFKPTKDAKGRNRIAL